MPIALKLTGQRFGKLVALERADRVNYRIRWKCVCDCGQTVLADVSHLRTGNTRSCGCLTQETRIESGKRNLKHGHYVGGRMSPTYYSWTAMRSRCENINDQAYSRYGGRGIKVCEPWSKFENFLSDMGERPSGRTLDRFPNNNGNYEPGNCRWATAKEQNRNSRNVVLSERIVEEIRNAPIDESTSHIARRLGLNDGTVRSCRNGVTWAP